MNTIILQLNTQKIPTARSGDSQWSPVTIKHILTSPMIAGLRYHKSEYTAKAQWEPILDETTWKLVCAILKDPKRAQHHARRKYLLSGLLRCGKCESTLNGTRMRKDSRFDDEEGNPTYWHRYKCSWKPLLPHTVRCGSRTVDCAVVEAYVKEVVFQKLGEVPDIEPDQVDQAEVLAEIDRFEIIIREAGEDRGAGLINRGEWLVIVEPAKEKLSDLRESLSIDPNAATYGAAAQAEWLTLIEEDRREEMRRVIRRVLPEIYVLPAPERRWTKIEARIAFGRESSEDQQSPLHLVAAG